MIRLLTRTQVLPITLKEAWEFFYSPANLNEITPPNMSFEILSELPPKMYEGMFIRYKISPLLGIKLDWCTEITHIDEEKFFVDEQRVGPYKIWHHEHHFRAVENGVEMVDILHYDIGLGMLGWLAGKLWVDQQVKAIFDFRYQKLTELFNR